MRTVGRDNSRACIQVTRRDFLRAGGIGLGACGLSLGGLGAPGSSVTRSERSVILLLLVGGPSQLETFDPKPDAPVEIRGPFGSIATSIPGVRISEHLPSLGTRMNRVALVRSVYHDEAPIHETGLQLLQTGRLCRTGEESPHIGSVLTQSNRSRRPLPPSIILPCPIARTGVDIPHGQSAGWLGSECDPFQLSADPSAAAYDPRQALDRARAYVEADLRWSPAGRNPFDLAVEGENVRKAYGRSTFGQGCLLARRLVEAGVRAVTVNMFDTVFNRVTWDCHGTSPFSTLSDYADELLPTFDRAFGALLDDLERSGRLESTLVLAAGEFGRTPRLNATGGRDHWPGVWSVVLAGGGVRGGQVVGSSDSEAGCPADRPVTPQDLLATIYHSLGIDHPQYLIGSDGESRAILEDGRPILELFA
ncbi:MAG: DUF1501 domain-containing protein [Isosphaeraceae bacterium]